MAGVLAELHSVEVHREVPEENIDFEKEKIVPKSMIVTDKFRTAETIITSQNLLDFLAQGREFLGLREDEEVFAVLEDDGTEVDEEEYFQLLSDKTYFMILSSQQIWSPTMSLQGSFIFDSTSNLYTSGQLAYAIMEHIKRVTLESQDEKNNTFIAREGSENMTFANKKKYINLV